jgi:hypothetical protein
MTATAATRRATRAAAGEVRRGTRLADANRKPQDEAFETPAPLKRGGLLAMRAELMKHPVRNGETTLELAVTEELRQRIDVRGRDVRVLGEIAERVEIR